MTLQKFLQALTLTVAIFGFAGWLYIAGNAVFHPHTLSMPLTHFRSYPREDTFGAICFALSFISCFVYLLIRDDHSPRKR